MVGLCCMYLAPLNLLGCHDDDSTVFLPHHSPEVSHCAVHATLRGDVLLFVGYWALIIRLLGTRHGLQNALDI